MKKLAVAGLVATVLAAMLSIDGFTSFPIVRIKAVKADTAPTAGRVRVALPPTAAVAALRRPFALIWHVRNDSAATSEFALDVDGHPICRQAVRAHATPRIDCILSDSDDWEPRLHTITVTSDASAWTLAALEVASHEGRLSDPLNVLLVPKASNVFAHPTDLEVGLAWLVVAGLLLAPVPQSRPRRWLVAHRVASGFVITLFALVVLVPLVSRFGLVFSIETFWRAVVVLLVWRIWSAATRFVAALRTAYPAWKWRLASAAVTLVVAFVSGRLVTSVVHDTYHDNYSGFLHIAEEFFGQSPVLPDREAMRPALIIENPGGYDGQFVYFMTFDPLLRTFHDQPNTYGKVVDMPPYRYGRIGLSVLTRLVARDHWRWYPTVIIWLVVAGLALAAAALAGLARARGASPFWGALVLVVPGFWLSVQLGLPEPLAAGFMLAGIWAVATGRWSLGAALCAASLFFRETGAIAVTCLTIWLWLSGRHRPAIRFAAIACLPFALWRLYVGVTLYPAWGHDAFFYNSHDISVPLLGIADLWRHVKAGTYNPGYVELSRAAITYPLLLLAGFGFAVTTAVLVPNPVAIAAALYGLLALSLRYGSVWVHVGNGERVTFELFVMLAATSAWVTHAPRTVRIVRALFWLSAALYLLFGTFEAGRVRETLSFF